MASAYPALLDCYASQYLACTAVNILSRQTIYDITNFVTMAAHTEQFAEATGTDFAMEQSLICAKGHVLTAIDLMSDPKHLEAIHEEFSKISKRPADINQK